LSRSHYCSALRSIPIAAFSSLVGQGKEKGGNEKEKGRRLRRLTCRALREQRPASGMATWTIFICGGARFFEPIFNSALEAGKKGRKGKYLPLSADGRSPRMRRAFYLLIDVPWTPFRVGWSAAAKREKKKRNCVARIQQGATLMPYSSNLSRPAIARLSQGRGREGEETLHSSMRRRFQSFRNSYRGDEGNSA